MGDLGEARARRWRGRASIVVALSLLAALGGPILAADAARQPPTVHLEAPAGGAPAVTTTGGPIAVRFSIDRPAHWEVGYRPAGSGGPFSAFPDAAGHGRGPVELGVVAPAGPGVYDLAVTARHGSSQGRAVAERSIIVTGPGVTEGQRCDVLDPTACLLPFPNDAFTAADGRTDTGRRVDLDLLAMPRNVAGKPVDPTEWNRNDGFSPGSMVLAHVPGIDLHATWGSELDHIQDLSWYARPDAPIVLLDADTGDRHPFWSELDSHAASADERLLILRPAVNLTEGHRYIVALRDLRRADGSLIEPRAGFAAYRGGEPAPSADPLDGEAFEARRPHMERLFRELDDAGIGRSDLFLAWDFTVASERNLTERALHLRDTSFAGLGDGDLADLEVDGRPPTWAVTQVTEAPDDRTMRRVEGTIEVPSFLTPQADVTLEDPTGTLPIDTVALPLSRFNRMGSPDDLPVVNPLQPTVDVGFVCNIPPSALEDPASPLLYGHGLLGSRTEANGSSTATLRDRGFAPCAVDWWGMSSADLATVFLILTDLSHFPSLADRAQQGFLNFLFLGRALRHPDGLVSDPAFRGPAGEPLLAPEELAYDGNSQGGIMGGPVVALSPDLTRGKLGVPGMNYSTLLNRSVDWEADAPLLDRLGDADPTDPTSLVAYSDGLYAAYPSVVDQQLAFALIQMLWDRAETNGYAAHLTDDPLPGTPPHQVMLQVAFADHQVANVAAEVEARTIGAHLRVPAVPDGLHWAVEPTFGLRVWDPARHGSLSGASVLVYWHSTDRGLTTPPNGNEPPRTGEDPHGDPRKDLRASDQVARFLRTGEVVDVCDGGPCLTDASRR